MAMSADIGNLSILHIAACLAIMSPLSDKLMIVTDGESLRDPAHTERGLAVTLL